MDLDTIDLNRAEQAVFSLSGDIQRRQQKYQPKTIQKRNHERYAYLPLYPTVAFGPNNHRLLANVSGSYIFIT